MGGSHVKVLWEDDYRVEVRWKGDRVRVRVHCCGQGSDPAIKA